MESPRQFDIEQIKQDAVDDLLEDSSSHLDDSTSNRRLTSLKIAKVLAPSEIAERVKSLTGLHLSEDKVGGIILPDGEDKLGKLVILESSDSETAAYHTAVHEGIHLLGPDSRQRDHFFYEKEVLKSMGPMWTVLFLDEEGKVVDRETIPEGEKLFWEAATDYVAAEKTIAKFGREQCDDVLVNDGLGFIQRYWLEHLINDHPNPEELEGAMKKALYKGDPNDFYRILGGRLDNPEIPFYHTLVAYMHEGEVALENDDSAGYQAALDKWMEAVKYHFENGGAYSLDMTNF